MTSNAIVRDGEYITGRWTDRIRYADISDGSSNTFLAGEMHIPRDQINTTPFNGPMFNGIELDGHSRVGGSGVPILTADDDPALILGFGSAHPGACNFVRSDGSTGAIGNDVDTVVLANLCNRADGEVIGLLQ